jgi:hypothetical protein
LRDSTTRRSHQICASEKDADDIDAAYNRAVKQQMQAARTLVTASANFGTCPLRNRPRRRHLDVPSDLANIKLPLVNAPMFHGVSPTLVQIALAHGEIV